MSRGFVGNRSTGKTPGRSAKELFMSRARGEDENKLSPEARYEKLMTEKLEDIRKKVKKSTAFAVNLPGTEKGTNERTLSKAAQDVIEKLAKERARKHAKKNQYRNMNITARAFTGMQGGRIDNKGRIYGPDGKYIAYVCKKTGKVKNRWGNTICKYTDNGYCDFKIARFISHTYNKKKATLYASKGVMTLSGGVYGSLKDGAYGALGNTPANSGGWGNGSGNIWGNSDNSGGGGFWG
jgi:hypothetical protein